MSFASMPSAIAPRARRPAARAGRDQRKTLAAVPELPTVAESGCPGFETSAWQGLLAPAGTPRAIISA